MFTPAFSAMLGISGPTRNIRSLVFALLVGQTSALWLASHTKCT
jgi:hypothetical protein